MKISISIYTHSPSVCILPTGSRMVTVHQKTFIDNIWFIGNKYNDGFTNRQSTPKKHLPSSSRQYHHR